MAPPCSGIVVGRIVNAEPHPNSDHLRICEVDVGARHPAQRHARLGRDPGRRRVVDQSGDRSRPGRDAHQGARRQRVQPAAGPDRRPRAGGDGSADGSRAAQAAATQWAAGLVPGVDVLGLVIVADAPGRLPRPLRDFAHLVGGGVPRTWNVPWIELWRLGEPPALSDAPREVRRLVDELHALVQSGAAGTTN